MARMALDSKKKKQRGDRAHAHARPGPNPAAVATTPAVVGADDPTIYDVIEPPGADEGGTVYDVLEPPEASGADSNGGGGGGAGESSTGGVVVGPGPDDLAHNPFAPQPQAPAPACAGTGWSTGTGTGAVSSSSGGVGRAATWVCRECTFINTKPAATVCDVCRAARTWVCLECTYENPNTTATACDVSKADRPAPDCHHRLVHTETSRQSLSHLGRPVVGVPVGASSRGGHRIGDSRYGRQRVLVRRQLDRIGDAVFGLGLGRTLPGAVLGEGLDGRAWSSDRHGAQR